MVHWMYILLDLREDSGCMRFFKNSLLDWLAHTDGEGLKVICEYSFVRLELYPRTVQRDGDYRLEKT